MDLRPAVIVSTVRKRKSLDRIYTIYKIKHALNYIRTGSGSDLAAATDSNCVSCTETARSLPLPVL